MTPKQLKLLNYLKGYIDRNGLAPSFEDMRIHLGLASKSGVHRLLGGLEKQHAIRREHHKQRAITVVVGYSTHSASPYGYPVLSGKTDDDLSEILSRVQAILTLRKVAA